MIDKIEMVDIMDIVDTIDIVDIVDAVDIVRWPSHHHLPLDTWKGCHHITILP